MSPHPGFLGENSKRRRYARILDRARVIQRHWPQVPWREALRMSHQLDKLTAKRIREANGSST